MSEIIKGDRVTDVWLRAIKHLISRKSKDEFTLVLEISNPTIVLNQDKLVIGKVNDFLIKNQNAPIATVANTIFPVGRYKRVGRKALFDSYLEIYPTIKKCKNNKWGTYFHRMTNRISAAGEIINPLDILINKLSSNKNKNGPMKSCYELDMVDPFLDIPIADPTLPGITYPLGGPCLSHLSFKIIDKNKLGLTVFYRSHYYLERALGNLIGLSQLMEFVARESGLEVGPLVCISSYAVADRAGATVSEISNLLHDCETALNAALPVISADTKIVNLANAA